MSQDTDTSIDPQTDPQTPPTPPEEETPETPQTPEEPTPPPPAEPPAEPEPEEPPAEPPTEPPTTPPVTVERYVEDVAQIVDLGVRAIREFSAGVFSVVSACDARLRDIEDRLSQLQSPLPPAPLPDGPPPLPAYLSINAGGLGRAYPAGGMGETLGRVAWGPEQYALPGLIGESYRPGLTESWVAGLPGVAQSDPQGGGHWEGPFGGYRYGPRLVWEVPVVPGQAYRWQVLVAAKDWPGLRLWNEPGPGGMAAGASVTFSPPTPQEGWKADEIAFTGPASGVVRLVAEGVGGLAVVAGWVLWGPRPADSAILSYVDSLPPEAGAYVDTSGWSRLVPGPDGGMVQEAQEGGPEVAEAAPEGAQVWRNRAYVWDEASGAAMREKLRAGTGEGG